VLIAGAPHPEAGKELIDYLLSKDTEQKLALSDAAQMPLHPGVAPPSQLRSIESIKVMNVNYAEVAAKLQAIQPYLKDWVAGD
jgi:iron(III) transport system substrate-binding protein